MDDKKDKGNKFNQDIIYENRTNSKSKIYNYFYSLLSDKKDISFLEIYILYILETIQLISYGISDPHIDTWKEKNSAIKTISDIIGISRISTLMKYIKFDIYLIIFFVLIVFIFTFCVFITVQIIFFKNDSKFFSTSVNIIRSLIYPLFIFFFIPITELVLLPLKCNSEKKVDLVKDGIKCWDNLHYLYSILGIISSILFLVSILFLINFFFYPFNYRDSSIPIHSTNNVIFLFIKYIFVLRFVIVKNEYLSIAILFILTLYVITQEFYNNTYNSHKLETCINLKNFLAFWTYFILLFAKFFKDTKINGLIYVFCFGIPFIIISCVLLVNKHEISFEHDISNFSNSLEYLQKTRVLIKLITSFIEGSKNIRFGAESSNQKDDIILKGIIKIHTLKCIREDCPLTKFIQNPGNYNVQKQCLLNYMTIYFGNGMKHFPYSTEIVLYYIQFNFSNRSNLNSVRTNISLLQNGTNTDKLNFIIFMLSKDIRNMKSKNVNGDSSNYEQEHEILNQKYRRLKYLIENSTKLYGQFWGIFATNVTNNLNVFKLYNLGQKLNLYLKEINFLWDNELKTKKVDSENELVVQLYSRFLREILWNKKKSEEISKKLNGENQHNRDIKKQTKAKNVDVNGLDVELETPNYIIYSTSNEKGECSISQCSSSIANSLGYMKSEIIGKKIEILMPEIFRAGHANMLSEKIKQMHTRHKSDRNSYRENDKKDIFILAKSKMGYLTPLTAKTTLNEDADFSNSFIIKMNMEPKDTKSVYAYYILTKDDFSVCGISSSAINLGLTMDILNKYVINIEFLIRDKNLGHIDFMEKIKEYEEELKEVIWVYPNLLYPKDKIYNEIKNEDIQDLITSSHKRKIYIQISVMKFEDSDILGYAFKIVDSLSKKRNSNFEQENFIPNSNKEILFDLLNLNYIRTEIVSKKVGNRNLREKEENIENEKQINKSTKDKNKKVTNISNMDDIIESSEDEKKVVSELTKEKIMELQTKDTKDIENFINQLPYYGADVFLEKHRPNREKYPIGKGQDSLIKISIGHFIQKIEKKINSNPELLRRYKGIKEGDTPNKDLKNEVNLEFTSDTSNFLANIFKSKSIVYLKLTSLIFFLIFLFIIIMEFIFTFLNVQKIKDNIVKMRNAYKLCEDIGFIKYCVTEIVLVDKYQEDYIILIGYYMTPKEDIDWLKEELEKYSYDFRSVYENFSSTSASEFSERYQNFISNGTQVKIYTLTNGQETTQEIPYTVAMTRIPTTIFYISTLIDESIRLNLEERNLYELMINLLNGYYLYIKELTLILAEDAYDSSKTSVVGTIVFYASFVLSIAFLAIIWNLLTLFLLERQKPINLFLTIKNQIFEDLKNASESFSNKLLNKLIGNEDNEEENQKDYQTNIKESDINIIKFKAPNDYKKKGSHNKEQIRDFIKLVFFFVLIEAYIIFKFFYSRNYIEDTKKFLDVFNITYYSYVDIIINIDLSKQFIYNNTMPIFYYKNSETGIDEHSPFYDMFYTVSENFEQMIIKTFETSCFLKEDYKETLSFFLYKNFSDRVFIDTEYMPNLNLLNLLDKGFKPVVFNIFEKLRFVWIQCYSERSNTINDMRWCDIDYLVLYVVRPWYGEVIDILHNEANHFLNGAKIVQITLFIVVIVIFILCYFIIWKSYEERLSLLLDKSFDLIKLIPEEIKYIIVSKLNE